MTDPEGDEPGRCHPFNFLLSSFLNNIYIVSVGSDNTRERESAHQTPLELLGCLSISGSLSYRLHATHSWRVLRAHIWHPPPPIRKSWIWHCILPKNQVNCYLTYILRYTGKCNALQLYRVEILLQPCSCMLFLDDCQGHFTRENYFYCSLTVYVNYKLTRNKYKLAFRMM